MHTRQLGKNGPHVSAIGLGCMGMSEFYGQADEADPTEDVLQDAFTQASGTLDMWDSYVSTLGDAGNNGSLRQAYALLQGIDGQVASLKENTAGLRGQNPGLDTLVNNLEVLATTEKFKFNRGDYNV